ncbi:MAG: PAS domain S-box protein [Spirochaetota bacterium]
MKPSFRQNTLTAHELTDSLLQLSREIDISTSIKECAVAIQSSIIQLGLPLVNISFLINDMGDDYLLLYPIWNRVNELTGNSLDYTARNEPGPIDIRLLIKKRKISRDSIIFSLMRGIIVKSESLLLESSDEECTTVPASQFMVDFFTLSGFDHSMLTHEDIENIVENADIGGILSFPLRDKKNIIGTLDFAFPSGYTTIDTYTLQLLHLAANIIASGFSHFLLKNRMHISESKYRSLFDATPVAMGVLNSNLEILETNSLFHEWFSSFTGTTRQKCYEIMPGTPGTEPCPQCLVHRTFETGKIASREKKVEMNNNVHYLKYTTAPVLNDSGSITSVIQVIEDITSRRIAEQKIENYNLKLEEEISQRTSELKNREQCLASVAHTIYEIKQANNLMESISKIIRGFSGLNAISIICAIYDQERNDVYLADMYPDTLVSLIKKTTGVKVSGMHMKKEVYPDNPLIKCINTGTPIHFNSEEEVTGFISACFPEIQLSRLSPLVDAVANNAFIVFPLSTKYRIEGSIAIAAPRDLIEMNLEYYQLLIDASAVEISRQKNSDKLAMSEIKYRNLVENSSDIIFLCKTDGEVLFANRTFYDTLEHSHCSIQNMNIYSLFSSEHSERLEKIVSSSFSLGRDPEPFEIKIQSLNGKSIWTEVNINLVTGDEPGFQLVARNIERRKSMETHINSLTAFQEKILQNEMVAIVTTDLDGNITSWNRGATEILGYLPEEVKDKTIHNLIVARNVNHHFASEKTDHSDITEQPQQEVSIRKKDGGAANTIYMSSLMKNEEDIPIAQMIFFIDISEKKKLENNWKELNERLNHAQLITIVSLAKLAEYRDIETGLHLERIMKYTELIARQLAGYTHYSNYITEAYITDLVNSCLLHDIGKVGIPDQILHKPGMLTEEEYEIMKKHTLIGGDTMANAEKKVKGRSYLNIGKEIAYYHHERWDGSGYPYGLKGKSIPLSARIVSIADVYDALTTSRPYKEAYSHDRAMEIIVEKAGSQFDETIVDALLKCSGDFKEWKNKLA